MNKLEKRVSEEENKRIMLEIEHFTKEERDAYIRGYTGGLLYGYEVTMKIFRR